MVGSNTIDDTHMPNLNNLRYNSVTYPKNKSSCEIKKKNFENNFFIKIYRNIYEETCRTKVKHEVDVASVKQTSNIMKA